MKVLSKRTKHILAKERPAKSIAGSLAQVCQIVEVNTSRDEAELLRAHLGLTECHECENAWSEWTGRAHCIFCAGWGLLDEQGRALVEKLKGAA